MTRKSRMSALAQPGSRSALLASAEWEQRRELKRLSSEARKRRQEDQKVLRDSLREAARDPLARQLGDLLEARESLNDHLRRLRLPDPDRWYTDGELIYGQLDTQLLRVKSGSGPARLLRLTSAGEVVVPGSRDLLMAEPSPLGGLEEVPQALARLSGGWSSQLLVFMPWFCLMLFFASGTGAILGVLGFALSPSLLVAGLVLLMAVISVGSCALMNRLGQPQGRADWLLRCTRARGISLD